MNTFTDAESLALYEQGPYTLCRLTEEDVIALASGLANPKVRAMAMLALSGNEELERNAAKPLRKRSALAVGGR